MSGSEQSLLRLQAFEGLTFFYLAHVSLSSQRCSDPGFAQFNSRFVLVPRATLSARLSWAYMLLLHDRSCKHREPRFESAKVHTG
jgi:hypothetical protein